MSKNAGEDFFVNLEAQLADAKSERVRITDLREIPDEGMRKHASEIVLGGGSVFWYPVNQIYIMQRGRPQ